MLKLIETNLTETKGKDIFSANNSNKRVAHYGYMYIYIYGK